MFFLPYIWMYIYEEKDFDMIWNLIKFYNRYHCDNI